MRILFLLTQDLESPSGLGRAAPLARELSHLGHTVGIAALHSNYSTLKERKIEKDGVQILYVAPMHVLKKGNQKLYYNPPKLVTLMGYATIQLARAALAFHPDIIYVCKPHPMNALAGLAAHLLTGSAYYLDCDDDEAASNRFSGRWQQVGVEYFERQAPRWARTVTANTYATLERLHSQGIPSNRLVYLPNGFDPERFSAPEPDAVRALRSQLGLSSGPVVLYVGSLSLPSHPVDLLLCAFQQLLQSIPAAQLLLAGGGEDLANLQQQASQLGLDTSIHFCGRVPPDQVRLYYALANVSVDPVRDDRAARARSPLKMFESWACGVPFVSASVGDRPALAGEMQAGLLTAPGDPKALAEALSQVLTDPDLAIALSRRGLEHARNFTWDRLAGILDARIRQDFLGSSEGR